MSVAFTKLFGSITTSTIWSESNETRIVWITLLSMADRHGRVWASIPGLARIAAVPVEAAREAISRFLGPDPDSRTKDNDGRRIEEIDGGWRLINYLKYRGIRDDEDRKASNRDAWHRAQTKRCDSARLSQPQQASAASGRQGPTRPNAEAEAEADQIGNAPAAVRAKGRNRKPESDCPFSDATADAVTAWASGWKIPTDHPSFANFLDHHRKHQSRWRDWAAAWRTWLRNDAKFGSETRLKAGGPTAAARRDLTGFRP